VRVRGIEQRLGLGEDTDIPFHQRCETAVVATKGRRGVEGEGEAVELDCLLDRNSGMYTCIARLIIHVLIMPQPLQQVQEILVLLAYISRHAFIL